MRKWKIRDANGQNRGACPRGMHLYFNLTIIIIDREDIGYGWTLDLLYSRRIILLSYIFSRGMFIAWIRTNYDNIHFDRESFEVSSTASLGYCSTRSIKEIITMMNISSAICGYSTKRSIMEIFNLKNLFICSLWVQFYTTRIWVIPRCKIYV